MLKFYYTVTYIALSIIMRYLYGESDEKFVKYMDIKTPKHLPTLDLYRFRLNTITNGRAEFNGNDVPVVFKCTPDTLLNLCSKVVDQLPITSVFKWNTEDVCRWLRRFGYPEYQNTFRENFINGRSLLLVDASALSAMNIKNFDHMQHIAYGIRSLFYFEMTKFGRSISLAPQYHYELYKLFLATTVYEYKRVRRTDFWRRLQLIRDKTENYSHWELLERWIAMIKVPKHSERIGLIRRQQLYKCNAVKTIELKSIKPKIPCFCFPPCECFWTELDLREPWRFSCLENREPDPDFVLHCPPCVPPCTCHWTSKKYTTHHILNCLQSAFPSKYGMLRGSNFNQKINKAYHHYRLSAM